MTLSELIEEMQEKGLISIDNYPFERTTIEWQLLLEEERN